MHETADDAHMCMQQDLQKREIARGSSLRKLKTETCLVSRTCTTQGHLMARFNESVLGFQEIPSETKHHALVIPRLTTKPNIVPASDTCPLIHGTEVDKRMADVASDYWALGQGPTLAPPTAH